MQTGLLQSDNFSRRDKKNKYIAGMVSYCCAYLYDCRDAPFRSPTERL